MSDNLVPFLVLIMVATMVFMLGVILGNEGGKNDMCREAVKAGAAKWVIVTTENGTLKTKFEWIVPAEKKVEDKQK